MQKEKTHQCSSVLKSWRRPSTRRRRTRRRNHAEAAEDAEEDHAEAAEHAEEEDAEEDHAEAAEHAEEPMPAPSAAQWRRRDRGPRAPASWRGRRRRWPRATPPRRTAPGSRTGSSVGTAPGSRTGSRTDELQCRPWRTDEVFDEITKRR